MLVPCETHAHRMLRNAFELNKLESWDYPDNSELQAAVLNHAFYAATRLIEILRHVKNYAKRYSNE